jgi:hypothetical protein
MRDFDYHLKESTKGMEDHEFIHFNRAMGIQINSREHYIHELKKRKMVPDSMAQDMRETYLKSHKKKNYELSPKAREILAQLESLKGRNKGMIKLGEYPKLVEAMKEIGLDYTRNYEEYLT